MHLPTSLSNTHKACGTSRRPNQKVAKYNSAVLPQRVLGPERQEVHGACRVGIAGCASAKRACHSASLSVRCLWKIQIGGCENSMNEGSIQATSSRSWRPNRLG